MKTPPNEHEQNEQSFRAQDDKKNVPAAQEEKKVVDDDGEDSYSQDQEQFESMD